MLEMERYLKDEPKMQRTFKAKNKLAAAAAAAATAHPWDMYVLPARTKDQLVLTTSSTHHLHNHHHRGYTSLALDNDTDDELGMSKAALSPMLSAMEDSCGEDRLSGSDDLDTERSSADELGVDSGTNLLAWDVTLGEHQHQHQHPTSIATAVVASNGTTTMIKVHATAATVGHSHNVIAASQGNISPISISNCTSSKVMTVMTTTTTPAPSVASRSMRTYKAKVSRKSGANGGAANAITIASRKLPVTGAGVGTVTAVSLAAPHASLTPPSSPPEARLAGVSSDNGVRAAAGAGASSSSTTAVAVSAAAAVASSAAATMPLTIVTNGAAGNNAINIALASSGSTKSSASSLGSSSGSVSPSGGGGSVVDPTILATTNITNADGTPQAARSRSRFEINTDNTKRRIHKCMYNGCKKGTHTLPSYRLQTHTQYTRADWLISLCGHWAHLCACLCPHLLLVAALSVCGV